MRSLPALGLGVRPVGFGDVSLSDIDANASYSTAWTSIQKQMVNEGASQDDLAAAKTDFAYALSGLGPGLQDLPGSQLIDAAKQYVVAGRTVAGALSQVTSLTAASMQSRVPPQAAVQAFTGTLIGVAGIAGAAASVSAGVGAVIVIGIEMASQLISAIIAPTPPPNVCQGANFTIGSQNSGQLCVFGSVVSASGSQDWRSFPDHNNPDDAAWFTPISQLGQKFQPQGQGASYNGSFDWRDIRVSFSSGWSGMTPADLAEITPNGQFSEGAMVAAMDMGTLPNQVANFLRMYNSAWKANKELALNGMKSADDSDVLTHAVRIWNRSHSNSSTYTFPGYYRTGLESLAKAINDAGGFDVAPTNGTIQINIGPEKVTLLPFMTGGTKTTTTTTTSTTTTSTATKVATGTAVVAGTAAAGVGVYAWLTKQAYGAAWGALWKKSGGAKAWASTKKATAKTLKKVMKR